jgi:hypothetical protein
MKTIIDNETRTSKYLVADDYVINATETQTSMGDPVDFIIGDLDSTNSTVIEGVTEPDDWFGCKYTCAADGTFTAIEGWVDPREAE